MHLVVLPLVSPEACVSPLLWAPPQGVRVARLPLLQKEVAETLARRRRREEEGGPSSCGREALECRRASLEAQRFGGQRREPSDDDCSASEFSAAKGRGTPPRPGSPRPPQQQRLRSRRSFLRPHRRKAQSGAGAASQENGGGGVARLVHRSAQRVLKTLRKERSDGRQIDGFRSKQKVPVPEQDATSVCRGGRRF